MHNNYYFLRQLSHALTTKIRGSTVVSCFSQDKEELVLEFNNSKRSFFLKASLQSAFCCLSFPEGFNRARKNSVDLFPSIISNEITGIRQYENERSFSISLKENRSLLFKMHGNRANLILVENDKPTEIFRNHLTADLTVNVQQLDRTIDWSKTFFIAHQDSLKKNYFTFGKEIWSYLNERGFEEADMEARWHLLTAVRKQLEDPAFHIVEKRGKLHFTLLPTGKVIHSFSDPLKAITTFYTEYSIARGFDIEKTAVTAQLETAIAGSENYLQKNRQKLIQLTDEKHYQHWADLIMANLHQIRQGLEKITLENFYDQDRPVEIKLRKDLNAQRNAEVFYRKAKNRQIEIQKLGESIASKEIEIRKLVDQLAEIKKESNVKGLRNKMDSEGLNQKSNEVKKSLPYHEYEFKGFRIWVGKNAAHNDTLTLKHAFKEDLWLHARDVAGSHVLIKHQAGKNFPKQVIERAAELAAYHSKRKTDSLCPVIVTPKKFVRKRKGDPAGAVVVDREDVLMVTPKR